MANECDISREMMHGALDGDLEAGERERFDAHLAACPACRRRYETLARAVAAFEASPRVEPSAAFTAGVMRRVREAKARQARKRRVFSWATAGATAALAAASVVFWGRVFRPALGATSASWLADAARLAGDGWTLVRALATPVAALSKVASVIGTVGSHFVRGAIESASPVYLGAFVAIALFYLMWRFGSRAAAPLVRAI